MFKLIPSSNNLYEASKDGEVRRIISYVNNQPKHKASGVKKVGGKPLLPGRKENGYLHVSLHIDGRQCSRYIHRLVAEAWLGKIPPKMTVNHKDGDKTNNRVDNLEIISQSENNKHAFANGLKKPTCLKGEINPRAKTTDVEVREIRKEYTEGKSIGDILKNKAHLSRTIISNIVNNKTWRHILDTY